MWKAAEDTGTIWTVVRNSSRTSQPTLGIIRQPVLESSIGRVVVNCKFIDKVASLKPLVMLTPQLNYADCCTIGVSIVLLFALKASALALTLVPKLDVMPVLV